MDGPWGHYDQSNVTHKNTCCTISLTVFESECSQIHRNVQQSGGFQGGGRREWEVVEWDLEIEIKSYFWLTWAADYLCTYKQWMIYFFKFTCFYSFGFTGSLFWHAGFSLVAVHRSFSKLRLCGPLVTRPGIKPESPALQGGFLITGPPRKSLQWKI